MGVFVIIKGNLCANGVRGVALEFILEVTRRDVNVLNAVRNDQRCSHLYMRGSCSGYIILGSYMIV